MSDRPREIDDSGQVWTPFPALTCSKKLVEWVSGVALTWTFASLFPCLSHCVLVIYASGRKSQHCGGVGGSGDRCVGLHMGGSFAEVGCLHGADYYHQAAGAMDESVE